MPAIRLLVDGILALPNDHPSHIALRTYALTLSLSLGPALVPFLTSKKASPGHGRLKTILRRELGMTGFAFAMTVAVGGGAALDHLWRWIEDQPDGGPDTHNVLRQFVARLKALTRCLDLRPSHRTFLANALSSLVAITLMQSRRRTRQTYKANIPLTVPITPPRKASDGRSSATLDLTLLLLVRALDTVVQGACLQKANLTLSRKGKEREMNVVAETQKKRTKKLLMTTRVDAFVFWAASARIMWCFIYEPERLPHSYVKWISSLANIDSRLTEVLRRIRDGEWSYARGSPKHRTLLGTLAEQLGYPPSWGDPTILPANGGLNADIIWKELGVTGRKGVGGVPCNIVHGDVGNAFGGVGASCLGNAGIRGLMGFLQALVIYAPVHFIPILLTRPQTLLSISVLRKTTVSLLRSSLFLSSFISSIWYGICCTRSVVLPRIFPGISHDIFDGPYGCVLAGCLTCGSSIWIENGRRRGEIALYVLPRAIRASLRDSWLRSGSASVKFVERLAFVLSLATILSASIHRPGTLRGLSRWTLTFIMNGPNAGFWKQRRQVNEATAPEETSNGSFV